MMFNIDACIKYSIKNILMKLSARIYMSQGERTTSSFLQSKFFFTVFLKIGKMLIANRYIKQVKYTSTCWVLNFV